MTSSIPTAVRLPHPTPGISFAVGLPTCQQPEVNGAIWITGPFVSIDACHEFWGTCLPGFALRNAAANSAHGCCRRFAIAIAVPGGVSV